MPNLAICHGDWSKEGQQGNLTGDAGNTYGYDVESRLKTFSKTGTTASYGYDAFNRRVSKTVNGTATFYVYDGDDIIEERNSAGTLVADYVHGDQVDEPLTMTRGTTTYYYFADGLGSIRQLTNSAGAVQQTYDYNSYGKLAAAPTVVNPFTYTGREYDTESGNYYYRARYYSTTLGRFLQRDPIGYADGMNLYAYVHNSPANFTDPTGMFWWLAAVEGVLFLYDSYGLYMTLTDPCASNVEKTVATAAWVAGATSFGGGTVLAARRMGKEAAEVTAKRALNSFENLTANPKNLAGKTADEVEKILGEGWTKGAYGSKKTGWKFTKGDQSVFYHPGGGRHKGSYYGYASGVNGRTKIVGSDYVHSAGDKANIINLGN